VPEGDQDHGGVTVAMAIPAGHLHKALDLGCGEILASAIVSIWQTTARDCSLYGAWCRRVGCQDGAAVDVSISGQRDGISLVRRRCETDGRRAFRQLEHRGGMGLQL
jgi:hypothetical protein